jgi:hypothetical protein
LSPDPKCYLRSPWSSFRSTSEFDQAKQGKYKVAVADTAGTTAANVDILSITEGRRRAGSVKVETKVNRLHAREIIPDLSRA